MEKPDGCQLAERNKDIKDRDVNPVADMLQRNGNISAYHV
jgi:hypothetical protein